MEAPGSGVNKFTYWVAHSSLGAWTKLPHLTPGDVAAARGIKVLFSGDLERTIYTNPFFFGKEKNYVRAQIARISHSTTLCPKEEFKLVDEAPRDIEPNVDDEGNKTTPSTK
jgi:radial spoke head protein 4/6